VIPIISAARIHVSLPAIASEIASCIFIIRSISAAGKCCSMASTSTSFSQPLSQADISLAN
jgi:hypothetical protein